ncbi:SusD/RagB family nutrient-binding outer membrane lipoprotein [Chitinophaga caeni]|uniref:SusD/RagB family nutrient-binding outer membrane lipoprotein n=1 Tax=Chitinophaga caeni TaxID=2029983 RepID=A0A291QPE6_9BACT|nr:SusD/RagB family nutrient-binding outer membrane lipoprotein [Chitinophaga caeni]ATL45801.1 SusD/RagB family nutrient-binding outer membrane lipoprotein [Chitinophaga caeni]
MKKQILSLIVLGAVAMSSCKKYLDVNNNPNQATESSPELLLPQALTYSAANIPSLSDYGDWQVGYIANAGGFGGWGSTLTYNYSSDSYTSVWTNQYDVLNDYQTIIKYAESDPKYVYYNAVARIMKVFHFQVLVDNYNDIPYSQALKGLDDIAPSYDNAEAVYKDLYLQLDSAISMIKNAEEPIVSLENSIGSADVMFHTGTNMTNWLKFANSLKLKLLIRASNTSALDGVSMDFSDGFLTEDAGVNPGYSKNDGKQNPTWQTYHSTYSGSRQTTGFSRVPTPFILSFYNGVKISDQRGYAMYYSFPNTGTNQLGYTGDDATAGPGGTSWYTGSSRSYNADEADAVGVLKNRAMDQPVMLLAESKFLEAEAYMKGILPGDAKKAFYDGMLASYTYLFSTYDGRFVEGDPAVIMAEDTAENNANALVNWDLATTNDQKLEAIITQKYIALNFIHGHESWAEYRRTGYPRNAVSNNPDPITSFISLNSSVTTPDRLPGRILYPSSEFQVNSENVPTGLTVNDYVFWDRRK